MHDTLDASRADTDYFRLFVRPHQVLVDLVPFVLLVLHKVVQVVVLVHRVTEARDAHTHTMLC